MSCVQIVRRDATPCPSKLLSEWDEKVDLGRKDDFCQPTLIWCFGLVVWCSAKVAVSIILSDFFNIEKTQAGTFFSLASKHFCQYFSKTNFLGQIRVKSPNKKNDQSKCNNFFVNFCRTVVKCGRSCFWHMCAHGITFFLLTLPLLLVLCHSVMDRRRQAK